METETPVLLIVSRRTQEGRFLSGFSSREAAQVLVDLLQGKRSLSYYTIGFCTLVAECSWNAEAQWDIFLHGLADHIQKEIYALELLTAPDALIRVVARLWR